jgi:hypothetical protein
MKKTPNFVESGLWGHHDVQVEVSGLECFAVLPEGCTIICMDSDNYLRVDITVTIDGISPTAISGSQRTI